MFLVFIAVHGHSVQPGIYLVEGDTSPTQIIVSEELSEDDNFWLTNLRNDLTEEQLARVFTAAAGRSSIDAYVIPVIFFDYPQTLRKQA